MSVAMENPVDNMEVTGSVDNNVLEGKDNSSSEVVGAKGAPTSSVFSAAVSTSSAAGDAPSAAATSAATGTATATDNATATAGGPATANEPAVGEDLTKVGYNTEVYSSS